MEGRTYAENCRLSYRRFLLLVAWTLLLGGGGSSSDDGEDIGSVCMVKLADLLVSCCEAVEVTFCYVVDAAERPFVIIYDC